jgi:hypothetical protein
MSPRFALGLAALLQIGGVPSPDWSRPRDLPSLVVRWQRLQGACAVRPSGDVILALEPGKIVALDARRGTALWEHSIDTAECPYWWQRPIQVVVGLVAVAVNDHLYVVDAATGQRRHDVPLGGRLSHTWGPPLLVSVDTKDRDTLLSIDVATGQIVGRYDVEGSLYSLAHDAALVLVLTEPDRVTALRLPELVPRWTVPGFSGVALLGDDLVVGRTAEGDREVVHRVALASGRVRERLFQRSPQATSFRPQRWDLEFVESQDHGSTAVRRLRPSDGTLEWTSVLPAAVGAWSLAGNTLVLNCETRGRGVLARLEWRTGRLIANAYGLRDVIDITPAGEDGLALLTRSGIVVVSNELGPPESTTVKADDDVRRILATPVKMWPEAQELLGELEQLGPEALPVLAESVRRENGWALILAAWRLADADYRPAAGALASRLTREDASATRGEVDVALVDALARLGSDRETGALVRLLDDPSRDDAVRFRASLALVSIGSPDAIAAVDRSLTARRTNRRPGWLAPSAQSYRHLVGRPVDATARERALEREDLEEFSRLGSASSAGRADLPSGDSAVVFRDDRLGRKADLWLEEFDREGRSKGPATFLGVTTPGAPCEYDPCPIRVASGDGRVIISRADENAVPLSVDLAVARQDADQDGLTDLVERRLGTDLARVDSDGDGMGDAVDPVPNAAAAAADTERDQITSEILEQFHLFDASSHGLAVLVGGFAPGQTGRAGPTLVLDRERAGPFKEKNGLDALPLITVDPIDATAGPAGPIAAYTHAGARPGPPLGASDRAYTLTVYVGPLHAVGYQVIVRQHAGRWRIRHFAQAWIS